ncbi:MAG: histidine kinase [Bacteroidota bacterium]
MKYKIGRLFVYFLIVDFLFANRYDLIQGFNIYSIIEDWSDQKSIILEITSTSSLFLYALFSYLILMKFYLRNRILSFVSLIFSSTLAMTIRYVIEQVLLPILVGFSNYNDPKLYIYFFDNLYFAIIFTALGIIFFFAQYSAYSERLKQELILQNQQTELVLLRSQFNPHFLFNTLNNIYYLVFKKSNDALEAIQKLSALLRYSLYEASEKVPIQKELDYLSNFLELQKMRYDYEVAMDIAINLVDPKQKVAPFLFIPFIENAFKHGDLSQVDDPVNIRIKSTMNRVDLEVSNLIKTQNKDAVGGIGLENVKRRLALIYPDRHQLKIEDDGTHFVVNLSISL